uniref:Sugar phosphate isomerase/epimerase n=1 Tax=Candidatus Caldatribacterium saccharofermentans TaxID=1454753 RepID=A0A7V4WJV3_9BACT
MTVYYRYAIISGFLGQLKDRFRMYQEPRDLEARLELARRVPGVSGMELVYPYDFVDPEKTRSLLEKYNLQVGAVNVDIKGERYWDRRALTSWDKDTRKKAVEYLENGAKFAREFGSYLVTVCPLQDGYDYHFEVAYDKAWQYFLEGVAEVARANPDVRLSLEYKFREPLAHYFLGNVYSALYVCLKLGLDNVGVTLDVGHALFAGENPAESLVLLHREGKLFHVHINDNDGKWDWDLVAGSRNLFPYLEFLYYLRKVGYQGWISLDVTPKHRDPVRAFTRSIAFTEKLLDFVESLDDAFIAKAIDEDDPGKVLELLYERFTGQGDER